MIKLNEKVIVNEEYNSKMSKAVKEIIQFSIYGEWFIEGMTKLNEKVIVNEEYNSKK